METPEDREKKRSSTSSRSRSRRRRRPRIHQTYDWKQLCGSNWVILAFFSLQSKVPQSNVWPKEVSRRSLRFNFALVGMAMYLEGQRGYRWNEHQMLGEKKGATTWVTWANQLSCFTRSLVLGLCYMWSLCIDACCMLFAFLKSVECYLSELCCICLPVDIDNLYLWWFITCVECYLSELCWFVFTWVYWARNLLETCQELATKYDYLLML